MILDAKINDPKSKRSQTIKQDFATISRLVHAERKNIWALTIGDCILYTAYMWTLIKNTKTEAKFSWSWNKIWNVSQSLIGMNFLYSMIIFNDYKVYCINICILTIVI